MSESELEHDRLWSFPEGVLGHDVVPAAAVGKIDKSARKVWLRLTGAEVEQAPEQHDPEAPLPAPTIDVLTGTWATFLLRG